MVVTGLAVLPHVSVVLYSFTAIADEAWVGGLGGAGYFRVVPVGDSGAVHDGGVRGGFRAAGDLSIDFEFDQVCGDCDGVEHGAGGGGGVGGGADAGEGAAGAGFDGDAAAGGAGAGDGVWFPWRCCGRLGWGGCSRRVRFTLLVIAYMVRRDAVFGAEPRRADWSRPQ